VGNTEDDERSNINTKGFISVSQRATEVSGPTIMPLQSRRLAESCITDPPWSLQDMVNKRTWLNTYTWNVSDSFLDEKVSIVCPSGLIVNYLQSAPYERFLYWRGSVKFHVKMNGMRQHLGGLVVYFVPYTTPAMASERYDGNMAAIYGLNPLIMDPSVNPEDVLQVGFYNPKSYISINGPTNDPYMDIMGTFMINVLVPLGASSCAPQQVDFVVEVEFCTDADFAVPLHSAATGMTFYNREHAQRYLDIVPGALELVKKHGGSVSSVWNNYGTIDRSTVPIELTADDFTGAASGNEVKAAFDRAGRTWNPINITRKFIQNLANSTGSEMITRLDLNPSNMNLVFKEHFSTAQDEMDMSFLLHTPTWVANIPWPGASTAGTSLYSGFIGPMSNMFQPATQNQIAMVAGSLVPMTQWEYNAKNFMFWRGGIHIRFQIFATQFHNGRLALSLNYGAPPDAETGLRDATSQYVHEFEVSNEKRTFDFVIPYIAPTSVMQMCRGPISADDSNDSSAWWPQYFIGSWNLRVLTRLVTVCNSPPDAVVVMSMSGHTDFEVYMPTTFNRSFAGALTSDEPVPLQLVKKHSANESKDGSAGGEDAVAVPPMVSAEFKQGTIIAPPGHTPLKSQHIQFGPRAFIKNLRDVFRRYYPNDDFSNPTNLPFVLSADIATTVNDQPVGITRMDTNIITTGIGRYLAYWFIPIDDFTRRSSVAFGTNHYQVGSGLIPQLGALQYRFWRGSQRFKVIFGEPSSPNNPENNLRTTAYYVQHLPFNIFPFGDAPLGDRPNMACIAQSLARGYTRVGPGIAGAPFQAHSTENPYATDIAYRDVVNYVEIEVPFVSRYNVLPTAQAQQAAQISPNQRNSGFLFIFTVVICNSTDAAQIESGGLMFPIDILRSIGDDFRFGTFLGVPNVFPSLVPSDLTGLFDQTLFPDTWVITKPTREREDSFEKIEHVKKHGQVLKAIALSKAEYEIYDELSNGELMKMYVKDHTHLLKSRCDIKTNYAHYALPYDFVSDEVHAHFRGMYHIITDNFVGRPVNDLISYLVEQKWIEFNWEYEPGQYLLVHWKWSDKCDYKYELKIPIVIYDSFFPTRDYYSTTKFYKEWLSQMYMSICKMKGMVPIIRETYRNDILELVQRHGDTEKKTTRYAPTDQNIYSALVALWDRYQHEERFNARMAMNELLQEIETSSYQTETNRTGPDHSPIFCTQGVFLVDNLIYNSVNGEAFGANKKLAQEACALDVLSKLHSLADLEKDRMKSESIKIMKAAYIMNDEEPAIIPSIVITKEMQACAESNFNMLFQEHVTAPDMIHFLLHHDFLLSDVTTLEQWLLGFGYHLTFQSSSHKDEGSGITKVEVVLVGTKSKPSLTTVHYGCNETMMTGRQSKWNTISSAIKSAVISMLCQLKNGAYANFTPDDYDFGI